MIYKKAAFYTLGCKVNQYESEAMAGILATNDYNIVKFEEFSDVYIVNTCTVTGLADRKCRQVIRRAKKLNPDAVVVAMGCYSQIAPEEVAKIPEVDIVLGTDGRKLLPEILKTYFSDVNKRDEPLIHVGSIKHIREFEELGIESYTEHTRAFLKIQDGCNRYCSYCIIPYARGTVRSKLPKNVISDIKQLITKGYKEFVLTGIHLASYGTDLKNIDLVGILKLICTLDGDFRIRLGSIEPMTVTPEFTEFVAGNEKICPHFHISLQSGSDSVLKRMNRRYTASEYFDKCKMLKERIPNLSITTDIIVGFPGETEEEFEETLEFARKVYFSKIHVFKYSLRKGTPASDMPFQISPEVKEARGLRLIALSEKMANDFATSVNGEYVRVLFEEKKKDKYEGHCENYLKVICQYDGEHELCGNIYDVMIYGSEKDCLLGKISEN